MLVSEVPAYTARPRTPTSTMKSAFLAYPERCRVIYDRIKPGYADLRAEGAIG